MDVDNEIKIMSVKPGGSLEMPEFNVLYRGYGNVIIPSASGVVSTSISAPGCQVSPTTLNGRKGYKVIPNAGQSVTISLTGKDAKNKPISLGKFPYKVKSMPPAVIINESISKAGGKINVGMAGSMLNVTYTVLNVKCEDFQGNGNIIPASAISKVKVGRTVGVVALVKNNSTGKTEPVKGALTVTN